MPRYNFRKRDPKQVVWVEDDTLKEEDESEDETYVPPEGDIESDEISLDDEEDMLIDDDDEMEEDDMQQIHISMPKKSGLSIDLHIESGGNKSHRQIEDDYEEELPEEEDEFLQGLINKYVTPSKMAKRRKEDKGKDKDLSPAITLNEQESDFYSSLPRAERRRMNEHMKKLAFLVTENEVPAKFRVLDLPIADSVKANVIKKLDIIEHMEEEGTNESYKLRSWIDGFLRIPFGKVVPLPVKIDDGIPVCSNFLKDTTEILDKAVYGMVPAKTQIMQIIAQWISNPNSIGNVIALKGPPGVGKTSFARNGIAKVLKRPFEFFSLGGATDSATFVGHSYTYEGSIWGRIADAVINARCMNPVMYFDELDKISSTPHGEEVASMLIHLTDRSQNTQFHDRYFAGVDFDLSQVLFVFSFNDEEKVHPILKDRMQVIDCTGYNADDKKEIVTRYVWPELIDRIKMDGLSIDDEAVKYLIKEYSHGEEGVRTLIRCVETMMTRLNLLRIADETTAKSYKFYMPVKLPHKITVSDIKHLLSEPVKEDNESWRRLYT